MSYPDFHETLGKNTHDRHRLEQELRRIERAAREQPVETEEYLFGLALYWWRVRRRRLERMDRRARKRSRTRGSESSHTFAGSGELFDYCVARIEFEQAQAAMYALCWAEECAEARGRDRYYAGCKGYVAAHRILPELVRNALSPDKLLPEMRTYFGAVLTGYVGGGISLGANPDLRRALSGSEESVRDALWRELPGAVLAEWGEAEADGLLQRKVVRELEDLAEKPVPPGARGKLVAEYGRGTGKKLSEEYGEGAGRTATSSQRREDEELADFERRETLRTQRRQLDDLERAARLSPQQRRVFGMLRQGVSLAEIATDLNISEVQVRQQKYRAVIKLAEARRAAGL